MFSGHQLSHFLVKLGMGGNIFPGLPSSPQSFPQLWDPICVVSLSSLTGRGIMGQRVLQYLCALLLQKEPELLRLALTIKLLVYQMLSMFRCLKR